MHVTGSAPARRRPHPAGFRPHEGRRRTHAGAAGGGGAGLRRIQLRRKLERVQRNCRQREGRKPARCRPLLQEKMRLKRALMDPSLADEGPAARPA